ncbi:MAG TPA: hypothetical protein VGO73_00985 [Pyrinomonadaceae bacterium]|jgi:hypothetical protein|nr:hypothetical protein [Pyrinomonadaceae bacterium]
MGTTKWQARTRRDLIIEVWETLDCESVGASELERIQEALREKFGAGALETPASIARTVADEGAVLRHPEVFECDLKWREKNLAQSIFKEAMDFSDLSSAFAVMVKLEEKRLQLKTKNEPEGLKNLRDIVVAARTESQLRARSRIIDEDQREQSKEISEWLRVWLQAPELFSDWLDLRRRSPEFRKKFPED